MIDLIKKWEELHGDLPKINITEAPKINIFEQSINDRIQKIISGIDNEIVKKPDGFSQKLKNSINEVKKIHSHSDKELKQATSKLELLNLELAQFECGYTF